MQEDMHPVLQNRWKLEGNVIKYYGLRNYPQTLQRIIKLSSVEIDFMALLDGKRTLKELTQHHKLTKKLKSLIAKSVIIDINDFKKNPASLNEARYCAKCAANDFIIPGLEFDSSGKCAVCQANETMLRGLSTPVATLTEQDLLQKKHKKGTSRFDVALMYTGGKDSSFLLYYLAKVCKLRVLACTWTIPFLSPNAKANIQAAKKRLKNVEFIERNVLPEDLQTMYQASLALQGNTCLCPSLAYIIFYPLLVVERIPYIISGVEEAQHKNMILNGLIPLNVYKLARSPFLHALINLFRVVTLRPPFRKGRLETVTYLRQLAFPSNLLTSVLGYQNEMVNHLNSVFCTVPQILQPLRATLRKSDRSRNVPALINLDLNRISPANIYEWETIKEVLKKELGWQGVSENDTGKGLHTSCVVEDGKDYAQFTRFRNMESMIIPFSALELSAAVSSGNITREQAVAELKKMPGFSLKPPAGYQLMNSCEGLPCTELCGAYAQQLPMPKGYLRTPVSLK